MPSLYELDLTCKVVPMFLHRRGGVGGMITHHIHL